MTYSVLAIAPIVSGFPALAVTTELARIGDLAGVQLTQLTGPVTKQRIIDRLGRGSYNAVLWTGHGEPGHLALEGDSVDPRWLASQLKQAKIPLAILAACQTGARPAGNELVASFADVLPPVGVSAIVMLIEVDDAAAIEYDVALIQALVAGEPTRRAHEVGLEAIAHFTAMVQAPMLIPSDIANGRLESLSQRAGELNLLTGANPIETHDIIKKMADEMGRLNDRVAVLERWHDPPPLVTILRAAAVAIMVFSIMFVMLPANRLLLLQERPELGAILAILTATLAWLVWREADMLVRAAK